MKKLTNLARSLGAIPSSCVFQMLIVEYSISNLSRLEFTESGGIWLLQRGLEPTAGMVETFARQMALSVNGLLSALYASYVGDDMEGGHNTDVWTWFGIETTHYKKIQRYLIK